MPAELTELLSATEFVRVWNTYAKHLLHTGLQYLVRSSCETPKLCQVQSHYYDGSMCFLRLDGLLRGFADRCRRSCDPQ